MKRQQADFDTNAPAKRPSICALRSSQDKRVGGGEGGGVLARFADALCVTSDDSQPAASPELRKRSHQARTTGRPARTHFVLAPAPFVC